MGLAMHMYNDSSGKLPAGWVTSKTGVAPSPGWSWSLLILPNIEQGNLYGEIGPDVVTPGGPSAANLPYLQTAIKSYRCPADSGPDINAPFQNLGMSNYVINREVVGPDVNSLPSA